MSMAMNAQCLDKMETNYAKKTELPVYNPWINSVLLLWGYSSHHSHIIIICPNYCWVIPFTFPSFSSESTKRLAYRRKGLHGTKQRKWSSAAQWFRYRRQAVKEAVEGEKDGVTSKEVQTRISKVARRLWTAGHTKEQNFMRDKQHARRCLVLNKHYFLLFLLRRSL